jgi:hypothetical protein
VLHAVCCQRVFLGRFANSIQQPLRCPAPILENLTTPTRRLSTVSGACLRLAVMLFGAFFARAAVSAHLVTLFTACSVQAQPRHWYAAILDELFGDLSSRESAIRMRLISGLVRSRLLTACSCCSCSPAIKETEHGEEIVYKPKGHTAEAQKQWFGLSSKKLGCSSFCAGTLTRPRTRTL